MIRKAVVTVKLDGILVDSATHLEIAIQKILIEKLGAKRVIASVATPASKPWETAREQIARHYGVALDAVHLGYGKDQGGMRRRGLFVIIDGAAHYLGGRFDQIIHTTYWLRKELP